MAKVKTNAPAKVSKKASVKFTGPQSKAILSTDSKILGVYGKTVEGSPNRKQPRVEVQQVFKTKPFNFG